MYINNINILYYLFIGLIGLFVGRFMEWCIIRLPSYNKVFVREFFSYIKSNSPHYIYMIVTAILYIGILYLNGIGLETLQYMILIPMLLIACIIDFKQKIIPNRLNLTIFEVGLVFTFIQGITNVNIAIDRLLGALVGGGIFLFITFVASLITGKEAMGFGDVKFMGAIGLFFGWRTVIIISLMSFLLGAIVGIILMIVKKKKSEEYMPFGPFIVLSTLITIFAPFDLLLYIMLKIFTLGTYKINLA